MVMKIGSATSWDLATVIGRRFAKAWRRRRRLPSKSNESSINFSRKTAGNCGNKKSCVESIATAKRFCDSLSTQTGLTRVRFIEPDQVITPANLASDPSASFGIQTDADDVENVLGYYVDGEFVEADSIQHRRANVDFNVKRGLPLYAPVRKNLRRAERLLRNMSVVAEIQSAIALIRKHRGASRSGVEQFVANDADASSTNGVSGRTRHYSQYGPGTILDAPAGMEYDFPARGLDASTFVAVLQAELRAIAARLVMPEFMFTSDASNANFASTLVAEGPAMKMFERLQMSMVEYDTALMRRVIDNAVAAGKLPSNVQEFVHLQAVPPSLHVRDQLQQAQIDQIAFNHGILSPQTWSQHLGLEYDQEQKNLSVHECEVGGMSGANKMQSGQKSL